MRTILLALAIAAISGPAWGQTSYPMITHVSPAAVQRGKVTTVIVSGQQDFSGAYQAMFEGAGLTAEVVPTKAGKPPLRTVTLKLTVDAKAALGVRELRVVTKTGLSSIGQLVVCDQPVIEEKGDNNSREKAQAIAIPCVVAGRIEVAEDTDHFKFKAKAGQTFTFEAACARTQDKIHDLQKHADPILTLYDASGRELAANDDGFFADPLLSYTFKADGEYVIQLRDSKYDGDARWTYALLVTDRPYASHVYPPAARAGQEVTLEPVGSAAGVKVTLTAPATPGLHAVELPLGDGRTNPVPLLVSELRQFSETEPNDDPAKATRITLPCGVNGRIGAARDVDHFVFAAKKGQAVRFEVKARRFGTLLRSGLDSVIDIVDSKGRVLATNDDAFGKDALLVFTPPADGDYVLRVRDLNSKGGPTFVYHVEAGHDRPDFTLRCDGDKAMIGPGARAAWYVQVARSGGFTGPVKVEVKGLPKGVTASALTLGEGQAQGVVVLSADVQAQPGVARVEVTGTAEVMRDGKPATAERRAAAAQEIYFPGGGRGVFDVALHAVAVTEASDIAEVKVAPAAVVLRPGQEVRLEVEVVRGKGYDKGVSLDIPLRHLGRVYGNPLPAGVTLVEEKSKTLLGNGSKGHIVLRAAADAAGCEGVPIAVVAYVSVNFVVKQGYSSAAVTVSVRR